MVALSFATSPSAPAVTVTAIGTSQVPLAPPVNMTLRGLNDRSVLADAGVTVTVLPWPGSVSSTMV